MASLDRHGELGPSWQLGSPAHRSRMRGVRTLRARHARDGGSGGRQLAAPQGMERVPAGRGRHAASQFQTFCRQKTASNGVLTRLLHLLSTACSAARQAHPTSVCASGRSASLQRWVCMHLAAPVDAAICATVHAVWAPHRALPSALHVGKRALVAGRCGAGKRRRLALCSLQGVNKPRTASAPMSVPLASSAKPARFFTLLEPCANSTPAGLLLASCVRASAWRLYLQCRAVCVRRGSCRQPSKQLCERRCWVTATAGGRQAFRSLPCGAAKAGWFAPMPGAVLAIVNLSTRATFTWLHRWNERTRTAVQLAVVLCCSVHARRAGWCRAVAKSGWRR